MLRIKRNSDGNPTRFKARVVAGSNHQIRDRDFDAVYALVVDFSLVLLIPNIFLQLSFHKRHLDVKSAFLNC